MIIRNVYLIKGSDEPHRVTHGENELIIPWVRKSDSDSALKSLVDLLHASYKNNDGQVDYDLYLVIGGSKFGMATVPSNINKIATTIHED